MAGNVEPEPTDATPEDESAGELAARGPQPHLSDEEVAELEARTREGRRRFGPSISR